MTATSVNGLAVLADEPAPSPLSDKAGGQVYFKQIRSLLLENGAITYGCAHCDYTADSPASVRPHLNKHIEKTPKKTAPVTPADSPQRIDPTAITLADLLRQVTALNQAIDERDQWKARARKAEQDLATIQRAIRNANTRT
jgi:hypothetical protein